MKPNDEQNKGNKEYWRYLEETYREVATWPTWMRGESSNESDQQSCPRADRLTAAGEHEPDGDEGNK